MQKDKLSSSDDWEETATLLFGESKIRSVTTNREYHSTAQIGRKKANLYTTRYGAVVPRIHPTSVYIYLPYDFYLPASQHDVFQLGNVMIFCVKVHDLKLFIWKKSQKKIITDGKNHFK